jgi:adenylate cyclase
MVEERVERRLAAILITDVVGYSRLMGNDEAGTLAALKVHRAEAFDPMVAAHNGRIVKLMGDGTLVEFSSVVEAVQCAVEFQGQMAERNAGVSQDRRFEFRIGINLGDVILEGDDIYGDGVNVAARLETLAEPGGICISGTVHDAIGNKLAVGFEFIGEQTVKNIVTPVRAYQVSGRSENSGAPAAGRNAASAPQRPGKPMLAVKPFDNVGADAKQDEFADGITNGIIVALTRLPKLTIVEDGSPSMHKSREMTVQELGRQFDVRYVLKGSLRKLGDRVRVTAELVEVPTGRYLWAEHFDRDFGDLAVLFDVQDEITQEIITALDVKLLSGEAARIVRSALRNPAALDSYFNGELLLWNSTTSLELREAQRLFEETIRLEPMSSVGYAAAALAYWAEALSGQGDVVLRSLDHAIERAQEAIGLGDVTGYPHLVLAQVHLSRREYDEADAEADRAVSARPSCPTAYSLKASVLNYLGRSSEAIEHAQFALRLTPVHPPDYPAILASAFYGSERHEEAIAAARTAIELDQRNVDPYLILAASSVALGHSEEARRAARNVLKLQPDFSLAEFAESQPYKDQKRLDRLMDQLNVAGLE